MLGGRESKLDFLEKSWSSQNQKFAVIYGNHKCGKTSVLLEFAKEKKAIVFSAQKLNSYMNLRLFEKAVSEYSGENESFPRWKEAFARIADFGRDSRFLLAIDDFSDLVFNDKTILNDLRAAFDNDWKNADVFVAAACGKTYFTENEILAETSSGSVRRPVICKLDELDYFEASKLLPNKISSEDKLRYYCCLGGVPEYLKLVDPEKGFERNIREIFLKENSPLFSEPPRLFLDELREPEFYNSILFAISKGCRRINEIVAMTGESSTKVNKYLITLLQMQIVNRDIPFGEENGMSRKGIYSISSRSLGFWFRFVLPNRQKIVSGEPVLKNLTEEIDKYIEGKLYTQICMQYMVRKNKQGMLPFLGSVVSGYWNSLRDDSDIWLVAANQRNRQILFAECRKEYTEDFKVITEKFRANDKLFTEYWERFDMMFSIKPFSRELRNMSNMKLTLVDIDDLYR